jgi:hypothetical protein
VRSPGRCRITARLVVALAQRPLSRRPGGDSPRRGDCPPSESEQRDSLAANHSVLPVVSPALGPPTDWGELVQVHHDRAIFQGRIGELPAIDIHSLRPLPAPQPS